MFNRWLAKGTAKNNEPIDGSIITAVISLIFVSVGSVDMVAEIITMFFMVTYGAICLISFLEHFAADPSYRPTFRSKWYFSLIGAVFCLWLMFKINSFYAVVSLVLMALIYLPLRIESWEETDGQRFQGVIFQVVESSKSSCKRLIPRRTRNTGDHLWFA